MSLSNVFKIVSTVTFLYSQTGLISGVFCINCNTVSFYIYTLYNIDFIQGIILCVDIHPIIHSILVVNGNQ